MSFSNYLENALLDHVFGTEQYLQPTIYVALSTTEPGDDGSSISEPSGNNYARTAHASWTTASDGQTSNASQITCPSATGSWGTVTHFALYDAATNGNMLAWGALDTAKTVTSGVQLAFEANQLTVNLN